MNHDNALLKMLLEHWLQLFVILLGLSVAACAVGFAFKALGRLLRELLWILAREFSFGAKPFEQRINKAVVLGFFILALLGIIAEKLPAVLEQVAGTRDAEPAYFAWGCLVAAIFFCIASPLFVWRQNRERRAWQAHMTRQDTDM